MPLTRSQATKASAAKASASKASATNASAIICDITGDSTFLDADYHARFEPVSTPVPPPVDNKHNTLSSLHYDRSTRESTADTENTTVTVKPTDKLTLTLTLSTLPRSGSSTFVIGAVEDADIRVRPGLADPETAANLRISRRHLLLEFDEWSHLVVKDVSRETRHGVVSYEDDHYRHSTHGNRKDPPIWVIPPGRKVTFSYPAFELEFLACDHGDYQDDYLQAIQNFQNVNNNPIAMIGGLELRNQILTATSGVPELDRGLPLPTEKHGRYAWILGTGEKAKLGEGGYGEVVEVFNSTNWIKCAGKRMNHAIFLHEASLMRSLQHQHVAKYIDEEERPDGNYLILELCPFKDLGYQHRVRGFLEHEVTEIFAQATSALKYLHAEGVAHRDIKPGNILVRSRQPIDIAVSDFGISMKGQPYMATFARGTLMYMAPEVLAEHTKNEKKVDVRYTNKADIWSMGLVALHLLLPDGLPHPSALAICSTDDLDQRYARRVVKLREQFLAGRKGQPFAQLIHDMIQWDPAHRPTARECAERAASILKSSLQPPRGLSGSQQSTHTLLEVRDQLDTTQTAKRKGKDSSSQETIRLPPKKPRQSGVADDHGQARTPNSASLNAQFEKELAEEERRNLRVESLQAELDRERGEESDSQLKTASAGTGGDYAVIGSGPTSSWRNAPRSSRNSAATPIVQVSTYDSEEWRKENGLDFSSRRSVRTQRAEGADRERVS